MRIIFMGTPDFAVETLKQLVETGKNEIIAVITQPDRPKGRGQKMLMTPVKEYALEQHLPVYQPEKVKTPEFIKILQDLRPDIIVVAAFGQLLNEDILTLPRFGCVNVHASLLPKYRGAAPIHYALLNGESESGVTIMQMDIGMDTGDMLKKVVVPISADMTMGQLHDELKIVGASLLLNTLEDIFNGKVQKEKQNEQEATYAKLLQRAMEKIVWTNDAHTIHNLVRGFNPAPGAFTTLADGKNLKIWQSKVVTGKNAAPGKVIEITKAGFIVACGKDALEILEVQPESKKRMTAKVFCNGRGVEVGSVLGDIKE